MYILIHLLYHEVKLLKFQKLRQFRPLYQFIPWDKPPNDIPARQWNIHTILTYPNIEGNSFGATHRESWCRLFQ